jgi:hypothetical protein
MRPAAWVVLVSGCFAPSYPVGLPCGPDCPPGQVCRYGICVLDDDLPVDAPETPDAPAADASGPDAVRFDAMPGDSDGDGVVDLADNCPTESNPTQHDEDADAAGDPCDLCPHLAGPDDDGDGDGVGDACDPALGPHRIAHFETFETVPSDWNFSAAWQHVGESMVFTGTGSSYPTVEWSSGESLMTIGGSVTWTAGAIRQLVISWGPQEPATYYYCELYEDPPGGIVAISRHQSGSYTGVSVTPSPDPLPDGAFRITSIESVNAQAMYCGVELAGAGLREVEADTPGLVGFTAINLTARGGMIRYDYAIQIVVD